jgi:hypothetical protein
MGALSGQLPHDRQQLLNLYLKPWPLDVETSSQNPFITVVDRTPSIMLVGLNQHLTKS